MIERILATADAAGRQFGTLDSLGDTFWGGDPGREFGRVARRWYERATRAGAMLVWLDDAQNADTATAELLRHAVAGGAVRLIATHRDNADVPQDLEALVTEGLADRRPISGLRRDDAARMARTAVSPRTLRSTECERIVDLADGNPLDLRELARAVSRGDGEFEDGATLDRLVGRAVLALTPDERRVLDMIAVAEPAPPDLLMHDWETLTRLRKKGLVERYGDFAVRTDHPLRRAWLLNELGSRRREILNALVDEAQRSNQALDALTLLRWKDGSDRPASEDELERAARTAIACGQLDEARQVAARLHGDLAALLQAEARVVAGDVVLGLAALNELARRAANPHRLEAAWWSVRYHALALGQIAHAEDLLKFR